MGLKKYSDEMKEFIAQNIKGTPRKEMAKLFNAKFGLQITEKQMISYTSKHKLKNGLNMKFAPGHIPYNEGQKGLCHKGSEKGWFLPGNMPVGHREVGSERINVDGYVEIKTQEPNIWRLKHKVVFEAEHGKIQKGCVVIFLDQDRSNLRAENLKMITNRELLAMNRNKMFTTDAELTETATILAKVMVARDERKNGGRESEKM